MLRVKICSDRKCQCCLHLDHFLLSDLSTSTPRGSSTHTHNNYHYGEEEEEKLRGSKGSWGALLLYVTCKRVLSLFTDRIVRRLDIFYHFLWLIQVRFRPF